MTLINLNHKLEHYGLTLIASFRRPDEMLLRPIGIKRKHHRLSAFTVPFTLAVMKPYGKKKRWNCELDIDCFPKKVIEYLSQYQDELNREHAKQAF